MGYISGAEAIGFEPLSPNEPGAARGEPLSGNPPKFEPPPDFVAVPDKHDFTAVDVIACPPSVFDKEFDWIDLIIARPLPIDPFYPPWMPSDPLQVLQGEWIPKVFPKPEPPPGYYPDEARLKQMYIDHWNVPELHVPGQSSGDVFFV